MPLDHYVNNLRVITDLLREDEFEVDFTDGLVFDAYLDGIPLRYIGEFHDKSYSWARRIVTRIARDLVRYYGEIPELAGIYPGHKLGLRTIAANRYLFKLLADGQQLERAPLREETIDVIALCSPSDISFADWLNEQEATGLTLLGPVEGHANKFRFGIITVVR